MLHVTSTDPNSEQAKIIWTEAIPPCCAYKLNYIQKYIWMKRAIIPIYNLKKCSLQHEVRSGHHSRSEAEEPSIRNHQSTQILLWVFSDQTGASPGFDCPPITRSHNQSSTQLICPIQAAQRQSRSRLDQV